VEGFDELAAVEPNLEGGAMPDSGEAAGLPVELVRCV
jgi:hypothetical protein